MRSGKYLVNNSAFYHFIMCNATLIPKTLCIMEIKTACNDLEILFHVQTELAHALLASCSFSDWVVQRLKNTFLEPSTCKQVHCSVVHWKG